MTKWHSSLIQYALILTTITVVFLFFQTRAVNIEQHNKRVDILLQLKQAEGKVDRDLLQVTSFLLVQYDPFVDLYHRINALAKEINLDNLTTENQLFSEKLDQYLGTINEKFELLEQLKSKAALIRNGLHYLPVIANQFHQQEPDIGDEVILLLNQQYRHHLLPSFLDVSTISKKIIEVQNKYQDKVKSVDLFENVLFHMEANLKLMSEMVNLRESYVNIPSYQRFDDLYNYYTDYHTEQSRNSERYSTLLLAMTVLLFAILGYTIQKLNMAHDLSRKSHKQLVDAVNTISEAFALFAEDGRLILYNQKYLEFYPWLKDQIDQNTTLEDITFANISEGMLIDNEKTGELADYPDNENKPLTRSNYIEQFPDGRWFMANDSVTSSGEMVCVRIDITERTRTEIELRKLYRALEQSPASVVITDIKGNIEYVNPKFVETTGYSEEEAIGNNPRMLKSGDKDETAYGELWKTITEGRVWRGQFKNRKKDGAVYWESASISPVRDGDGDITHFIAVKEDVTAHKYIEDQLRLNATVFDTASEGIIITDANNHIKTVNPAFTQITGYSLDDVFGLRPSILNSGLHDEEFYQDMWKSLHDKGYWSGEVWNRRKDNTIYPEWLSISVIRDEDGDIQEHVAIFSDITRRKQDEEQIRQQANYDALTGLPNRSLLVDRLTQAITLSRRDNSRVALLFIDLDRFKVVNDTLGHVLGDELLKLVSQRLSDCVRESDTVARFGGDEFVVVLTEVKNSTDPSDVAQKVISTIDKPFKIHNREIFIGASIGITIYPDDSKDINTMLRNADMAMYSAKSIGRNSYQFYTHVMNEQAQQRMELERDLRKAIERNEFYLCYQPIIEIESGDIVSVEALIRWDHPQKGIIKSDLFIPMAEESGLIGTLGRWILQDACRQASVWQQSGNNINVNINISSRQLALGLQSDEVVNIINQAGIEVSSVVLEITEGFLLDGTRSTMHWLNDLKKNGVNLAIDDFGTGYSSLGYLKRYPMDTLKIDRSFIHDITEDPGDASLVKAIISMAHSLGLDVVAEGVETTEQLTLLKTLKCDKAQGYLISKPVLAKDLDFQTAVNL